MKTKFRNRLENKLLMNKKKWLFVVAYLLFLLTVLMVFGDTKSSGRRKRLELKTQVKVSKDKSVRLTPEHHTTKQINYEKKVPRRFYSGNVLVNMIEKVRNFFPDANQKGIEKQMLKDPNKTCRVQPYQETNSVVKTDAIFKLFKDDFFQKEVGFQKKKKHIRRLKVFVVPHFHNDRGWLSTDYRYHFGDSSAVLDKVVDTIDEHGKRRFVWTDVSTLAAWWDSASPGKRSKLKQAIDSGKFEVAGGSWASNENEGSTNYFSLLNQYLQGRYWLARTLNTLPRNSWSFDPYGLGPTTIYLLRRMGIENVVIDRMHHNIKRNMFHKETFEFRWRQEWDLDGSTHINVHTMPIEPYDSSNTCGPDRSICCQFSFQRRLQQACSCQEDPVSIHKDNIQERAEILVRQYKQKAALFNTDVLLVTLGGDFTKSSRRDVAAFFDNNTLLFAYMSLRQSYGVSVQFGTLSEYFREMQNNLAKYEELAVMTDKYLTDPSSQDLYWSGYHSSRTLHKLLKADLEGNLRGAEILFALAYQKARYAGIWEKFAKPLFKLLIEARKTLALYQHDDATAHSPYYRTDRYKAKILKSIQDTTKVLHMSATLNLLRDRASFSHDQNMFEFDDIYDEKNQMKARNVIRFSEEDKWTKIVIHNSLAYRRTGVVSLLVPTNKVSVISGNRKNVLAQVNLLWSGYVTAREDAYELQFVAEVPGTGLATYIISSETQKDFHSSSAEIAPFSSVTIFNAPASSELEGITESFNVKIDNSNKNITLENDKVSVQISSKTGLMKSVTSKLTGEKTKVSVDFLAYESSLVKDKSGVFRYIISGKGKVLKHTNAPLIRHIHGFISSSVHIYFREIRHRVTLYTDLKKSAQPLGVHVSNDVKTRSTGDNNEITMRLKSKVRSKNTFYSDQSGFQMKKRTNSVHLPLALNFHAFTSMAYIQDRKTRLSLLTAKPLGVASLAPGELEVVLLRPLVPKTGFFIKEEDLMYTTQNFVIFVEKWLKNTTSVLRTMVTKPSLAAHQLSWETLYPIIKMPLVPSTVSILLQPTFHPLPENPWSCDAFLLCLRALQSHECNLPTGEAAAFIHRIGFDSDFDSHKEFKPFCHHIPPENAINMRLESFYRADEVTTMSLSLLKERDSLTDIYSSIQLKPMEIGAYKISF